MKTHDFPSKESGKAIPYGVYGIANNEAGVTMGISHDTAEFAVTAIQRWWEKLGRRRFPKAKRVMVTADGTIQSSQIENYQSDNLLFYSS